jgi:cyclopropane fatty-acyl-phospholipid synthase-like methyltransferase
VDRQLISINYLELELIFCLKILKLKSLHYGYWQPDDDITMDNLKKAQERYTTRLIKLIPRSVQNVLDVGCGVGDNAIALAEKGYRVTGLTPSEYQYTMLKSIDNKNISFVLNKFEGFKANNKFDCIFMSESSHYFDMDIGLQKSRDLLNEHGYVLVANIFRKIPTTVFNETHIESEWLKCVEKYGFKVIERNDITKNVLPTVVFAEKVCHEYLTPIEEIINIYFKKSSPLRAKIIEFLFARDVKRLFSLKDYLFKRLNSDLFKKNVQYLIFLLQRR